MADISMTTDTLLTPPAAETARRDAPTGLIVAALLLVMLLSALDQTIVSTALPTIVGGSALDQLSWVVTAYLLSSTVVLPLYGKLGDLYGRKIVLQAAIVLFLAAALCGVAQDMTQLIVLRAMQGLGGGGLMVVTMAAIGDLVPPDRRARYQGCSAACTASRRSSARCSAASWSSTCRGAGSSRSTCRSAFSRSR